MLWHRGAAPTEGRRKPESAAGHLNTRPRTALARWMLDPVIDVTPRVREALIGDIDMSAGGMLTALANYILLDLICCGLAGWRIFYVLLPVSTATGLLRITAQRLVVRAQPCASPSVTDFYVVSTLLWCLLVGILTGAAELTDIGSLQVLGAASAMALQGALSTRNYAARRFATAMICLIDLPFVTGAAVCGDHWLIGLVLFTPGYIYGIVTAIQRFQRLSIMSYQANFASQEQARQDPLTGALNRLGLAQAVELEGLAHQDAVFCLDLDGFKQVNDTFGHEAGDILLKLVTARLRHAMRGEDVLARLGGDEFVILARGLDPVACGDFAARIVESVTREPYALGDGARANIGVSVGFACVPDDGDSFAELSRQADAALYAVKQRGKGDWQRATTAMAL